MRFRNHTRAAAAMAACAWTCIQAEVRRQLGRDDVVPGMIAAIQTHGELVRPALLPEVPGPDEGGRAD